ncbi:type VII secretion target [Mycolicibacterium celeriflavum]|uniref:type VII secretion target n=1 Tax=Mycolicibacterium celeriflavum TaxID=1249101 RepID=UPI003CE763D0
MSGDDVRVSPAHLGDLAARHALAASDAGAAARSVDGIPSAVRNTHGTIAASTADALADVLDLRDRAGTTVVDTFAVLSDKLADAAARYDRADEVAASALTAQMRTDQA